MTSNNFIQETNNSIELERKTINVAANNKHALDRYGRNPKEKSRHYSFSVKHSTYDSHYQQEKHRELVIPANLTMEELMESNRLVERKLTLFRKKKQPHPMKYGKIPELEEEEDNSLM